MSDINIQQNCSKFKIDSSIGLVCCKKSAILNLFGEKKHFQSEGYSHCTKENIFNEKFGRLLASTRANQVLLKQIEISLVKCSFDHFIKDVDKEEDTKKLIRQLAKILINHK